jgi:SAM-dependent methyltransferase
LIKASLLHLMQLQADLQVLRGGLSDDEVLSKASATMLAVSTQIQTAVDAVEQQTGRAAAAAANKLQLGPHGTTRLQLGAAGDSALEGWVNVDLLGGAALSSSQPRQELALNIATQPLPLKDESCAFVYAAHVLEHLEFPESLFFVLHEAWRVLKTGGTLRLAVPDARKWLKAYASDPSGRTSVFWKGARQRWPDFSWDEEPTLSIMLQYLGAIGAMDNPHRAAYDTDALQSVLRDAGFVDVKPSTFQGSEHSELRVDDTSVAARATFGTDDQHYSLFMEATKEAPQPQQGVSSRTEQYVESQTQK